VESVLPEFNDDCSPVLVTVKEAQSVSFCWVPSGVATNVNVVADGAGVALTW
jgi:hypothetical protein